MIAHTPKPPWKHTFVTLALVLAIPFATLGGLVGLAYVISNGPYPSVGLYWYLDSDPTAGGGMSAPYKQLLVRTDDPSLYYKSGDANTAWTKIGAGAAAGGTVTSIACGTGLSCTPSPITTTGTIAVNLTPTTCAAGQAEVSTAADGTSTCAAFGNTTSSSLTTNTIPVATGAHAIGDSSATDNGTTFGIGTKFAVTVATGALSAADGTLVVTVGSSAINTTFWQVNTAAGVPIVLDYLNHHNIYGITGDVGVAPSLSAGCGTGATVSSVKGVTHFTILTNATALGTCVATFSVALTSANPTCLIGARNAIPVVYDANATTVTLSTGIAGGVKYDVDCWDHP